MYDGAFAIIQDGLFLRLQRKYDQTLYVEIIGKPVEKIEETMA